MWYVADGGEGGVQDEYEGFELVGLVAWNGRKQVIAWV